MLGRLVFGGVGLVIGVIVATYVDLDPTEADAAFPTAVNSQIID
ncbi:hypothetical protein [Maliponia aquimaris]|uniref:Uncharacterized protein n=1 Tax=Maliponia aquimaris TaxID=1673631 RepID=A0A238JPI8_9RHOB|nr:hypothetical protein [Maliponia aquimaris]SMX32571.1 hypothetical protein MAA8898_00282 [Maliponia aquimaris]